MSNVWQEALARFQGSDLLQLGMDADGVRERLWPDRIVTYTVGFLLPLAGDWVGIAEAATERGARSFLVTGSELVPTRIAAVRERFPDVALTGASVEAGKLQALCGAGLSAVTIDVTSPDWQETFREACRAGVPVTVVMPLRSRDTPEQWIAMLEAVADLQAETHGFLACEPRIEHLDRALDEVTGARYLQFVALARIYLPEVPHVQADWSIFGPKVLQLALRFGADDAGLVLASARDLRTPSHHSGEEELRRIIRDAGFMPSERDAVYSRQYVY